MKQLNLFVLLTAIFVLGCETKKPLTTPDMKIKCPICQESAKLISFDEYRSKYECEDHSIEMNRHNGEFREAQIRYKGPQ